MFDYIKNTYKKGDKLKLTCINGEFSGEILAISVDSIILKTFDGKTCGIKGSDISFFEEIDLPLVITREDKLAIQETEIASQKSEIKETTIVDDKQEEKLHIEKETSSIIELTPSEKDIEKPTLQVVSPVKEDSKYKAGDKIPLDELYKIDPRLKRTKKITKVPQNKEILQEETQFVSTKIEQKGTKKRLSTIGNSFESLAPLVEKQHEIDNLKSVPAIGAITRLGIKDFGFIDDAKTGQELYFSFKDVVGDLQKNLHKGVGVIYTESKNIVGNTAICVHKSGTVKDLLALSEEVAQNGQIATALNILDHILDVYEDNFTAGEAKKRLLKQLKNKRSYAAYESDGNPYFKAKEFLLKKVYDKAIEYFLISIKERDRTESAVKDLSVLYVQLSKSNYKSKAETWKEAALNLLEQNKGLFPHNLTTQNFLLYNCYLPLGEYDKSIEIIDDIIDKFEIETDNNKCSSLLYIKAFALIRSKKIKEAEVVINDSLSLNPQNSSALQLQELIKNKEFTDDEKIESFVSATEFNLISGGLSNFILQTLNNYDEYRGAKTKDIESRHFTQSTLRDVREVISKAGMARAKERATYLLTEGKLMLELEPSEEIKLRNVMARYCNAMALSHISANSPMDIIRFFYNESFALEENWDSNVNNIVLFLLTHVHSYKELINDSGKSYSIEKTLSFLQPKSNDSRTWDNILSMCLNNGTIFAQFFTRLYNNSIWRKKAIEMLKQFGINNVKMNVSQSEFIEIWNSVRENRLNQQKRLIANIISLGNCSNIEEATVLLANLRNYREEWICPMDLNRINTIVNFILPALESFVKSSGFSNKESNYTNTNVQIKQFVDEVTNNPTKLSYEAMLPLMDKLRELLNEAFNDIVITSEPKITLSLLSTETVINEDGIVSLQISVENHKDSSPIKEVTVEVIEDKDVKFITQPEAQLHYNAIYGGESSIFKLDIKVSEEIIKNKATAINILCKYKSGSNLREQKSQVSLKLYSPEDYKPIENPYAPIADGGPVPIDSPMFFGREDFIANIVDSIIKSQSKQIIIYGQKRCGKSSVMLHLKEKLEATGKTFCVLFSLGDIIQNLTEASFYHKILSSIQDELEDMEFNGKVIPDIQFPNASDFKNEDIDNPVNTFSKYMSRFKRACKNTEGWEEKNLVVMIDEFTYLYTEIKKERISPSIMKQWKSVTQNDKSQFSVVLVGQDVVPSFKKEDYASNAFGVIQDIRLTYLQEEPARELIEKPILDENGESRYIGNAVSRIIDYTSKNPYYIQIFCARLVDYMNRNKSIKVTEADVNDVARSFIKGEQALEDDKFDNLIRAGETKDFQEFPEDEILAVLRQISISSKNIGYCSIDDINILGDRKREQEIIKHLIDREVLENKGENNYKIQVRLFQEWLLNH